MSVPSRYFVVPPSSQKGGSSLFGSDWSMGEWGVSHGANTATKTIVPMIAKEARGSRRIAWPYSNRIRGST